MTKSYNALIIGAGNIGCGYDNPGDKNILSHAHAYKSNKNFNLFGIVDISEEKGKAAAKKWETDFFPSISEAFENHKIDVVSVCVPTGFHYSVLIELLNYKFSLVFAEKPFTESPAEAIDIFEKYKNKSVPVIVNYSRRFVKEFDYLKKEIEKGAYGKLETATGIYGKGINNNGSHMMDFLIYLFDDIKAYKTLNTTIDYKETDPTISAILKIKNESDFYLQTVSCKNFTIFEIDLIFEKQRVRILNSGFVIEFSEVKSNKLYPGYKSLEILKQSETSLNTALYSATENIIEVINSTEANRSSILNAVKVQELCRKIINGKSEL